ncbi:MAG: hypothetical protein IPL46_01880 [Saprospiraceae bacterium]|nr:hypothetical protein [Saprospiraceae bacterium]
MINKAVEDCQVMLVVIGDEWLNAVNNTGKRSIDKDDDFVRTEIEAALYRNISVIPVLVGDQSMPEADSLPETIRRLAFRSAAWVRPDPDFHSDMDRLHERLSEFMRTDSRKLWKSIGIFLLFALLLLSFAFIVYPKVKEESDWKLVQQNLTVEALEEFTNKLPNSKHKGVAVFMIDSLNMESSWKFVQQDLTVEALEEFTNKFPNSKHKDIAVFMIDSLNLDSAWIRVLDVGTSGCFEGFSCEISKE